MNDEWLEGLQDYVTEDDDLAAALDLPVDPPTTPALRIAPPPDDDEDGDYYHYRPETVPPWTPALVFDVALGLESEEVIFNRHGITEQEWHHINTHPLFHRQVAEQTRELSETGVSFRAKARVQAEMYLVDIDRMVASPNTDQKVKLEAIRSMVKWGNLEPAPAKEEGTGAPQVNIQINM